MNLPADIFSNLQRCCSWHTLNYLGQTKAMWQKLDLTKRRHFGKQAWKKYMHMNISPIAFVASCIIFHDTAESTKLVKLKGASMIDYVDVVTMIEISYQQEASWQRSAEGVLVSNQSWEFKGCLPLFLSVPLSFFYVCHTNANYMVVTMQMQWHITHLAFISHHGDKSPQLFASCQRRATSLKRDLLRIQPPVHCKLTAHYPEAEWVMKSMS